MITIAGSTLAGGGMGCAAGAAAAGLPTLGLGAPIGCAVGVLAGIVGGYRAGNYLDSQINYSDTREVLKAAPVVVTGGIMANPAGIPSIVSGVTGVSSGLVGNAATNLIENDAPVSTGLLNTPDAPGVVSYDSIGTVGGFATGFFGSALPCLPAGILGPVGYWGCRGISGAMGAVGGNKTGDYIYKWTH